MPDESTPIQILRVGLHLFGRHEILLDIFMAETAAHKWLEQGFLPREWLLVAVRDVDIAEFTIRSIITNVIISAHFSEKRVVWGLAMAVGPAARRC